VLAGSPSIAGSRVAPFLTEGHEGFSIDYPTTSNAPSSSCAPAPPSCRGYFRRTMLSVSTRAAEARIVSRAAARPAVAREQVQAQPEALVEVEHLLGRASVQVLAATELDHGDQLGLARRGAERP